MADLGYTKSSALRVIHNLKNNSWIDERTRAVFVEFMIFDSATNLFSAASYILEVSTLGRGYHIQENQHHVIVRSQVIWNTILLARFAS